jgi:hypothetical protein
MRRRRFYPPDDPIIDRLVEKITLAYLRIDRGFEAEAEMLQQGSLAELLVHGNKPIKNLTGYEAGNRKALKVLEEELARYVSMLNETGDLESMTTNLTAGSLEEAEFAATQPPANDVAAPPASRATTPTKDRDRKDKRKTASASEPSAGEPALATSTAGASPEEMAPIDENPKTKPISTEGSGPPSGTTSATGAAATPSASPDAPPPPPAVPLAPPTMQPQARIQTNFDILNWGRAPPRR